MKVGLIIIGLILNSISLSGQGNRDCQQILQKEISLNALQENIDDFINDFQTLVYCEFDSIDYQIFMGPQGNMPLVAQSVLALGMNSDDQDRKFTFKELKDELKKFKQQDLYLKVRKVVEARNEIIKKNAIVQNWNQDRILLVNMGFTENQIDEIHSIVEKNDSKTYPEIFAIYSDRLVVQRKRNQAENKLNDSKQKSEQVEWIKGSFAYTDYELGLKKSKETKKPMLLYFNSYACLNSREIEEKILLHPDIQNYINMNMICVNLVVDARTKLKENEVYFSDILNKEVKYTGQVNVEFEIERFKSNSQPLFVLLDVKGNEISRMGYTNDMAAFKTFLRTVEK